MGTIDFLDQRIQEQAIPVDALPGMRLELLDGKLVCLLADAAQRPDKVGIHAAEFQENRNPVAILETTGLVRPSQNFLAVTRPGLNIDQFERRRGGTRDRQWRGPL